MCGRYYVDDETAREIEEAGTGSGQEAADGAHRGCLPFAKCHDPEGAGNHLAAEQMRWGFPGFEKGKLLINARAETALERPTFRESVQDRRCIIPARGFYEWNKSKEKVYL